MITNTDPLGEVRPIRGAPIPHVHFRREPIPPEACRLGPRCLVCRWRREGLIPPASGTTASGPVR